MRKQHFCVQTYYQLFKTEPTICEQLMKIKSLPLKNMQKYLRFKTNNEYYTANAAVHHMWL